MAEKKSKRPKGRPTLYKEKYCEEIIEYFDVEMTQIIEEEVVHTQLGTVTLRKTVGNELPTIAGFARSIGVWRQRVGEWANKYPDFSVALKKAKNIQAHMLITNGLMGRYDKSFAIFAAKNLIGWRDKQEVENQGSINISYSEVEKKDD